MSNVAGKTFLSLVLFAAAVLSACSEDSPASLVSTQAVPTQTESAPPVFTQAEPAPSPTVATQVTVEDPAPGPDSPAPNTQEPTDHSAQDESTPSRFGGAESLSAVPSNLAIPFDPSELAFVQGFLSPFGVVRSLKDRPEFGHSGIDVPLIEGAAILAVADGTVISVLPAEPKFPGEIVLLLINPGDQEGEGWVFLMEHVELVLSELSAQPRKSPIFTLTEAVNPECANTNGG